MEPILIERPNRPFYWSQPGAPFSSPSARALLVLSRAAAPPPADGAPRAPDEPGRWRSAEQTPALDPHSSSPLPELGQTPALAPSSPAPPSSPAGAPADVLAAPRPWLASSRRLLCSSVRDSQERQSRVHGR
ncbi:predicted GPI-anchored protein 58 [Miscanthus floridulus]|uniref:predicted GPI-anchored protein 58 n=1 Tax=Miscanthus floridulus TaxID=154761 RepID=UPI003458E4C6